MSNLSTCCIMLANGRPEMVKRAVRSFRAQSYQRKALLIFDSGQDFELTFNSNEISIGVKSWCEANGYKTVGQLRNVANACTGPSAPLLYTLNADVLLHWDSDDWSHPRRIEEQVALLEQTKADAVGYNDMLFWESVQLTEDNVYGSGSNAPCDVIERAWLYRHRNPNYCLGTSLCYWRKTWEQVPFLSLPVAPGGTGEEFNWLKKVNAVAATSMVEEMASGGYADEYRGKRTAGPEPRMIASIHGSNTQYYGDDMLTTYAEWSRAPEWDAHCRKVMEL